MKKQIIAMAVATLFACGSALAQQPAQSAPANQSQHHCQHHGQNGQHCGRHQQKPKAAELQYNADGLETTLVRAFPTAKSVKKTARWTEVYDANKKLLGYAVYSKPASDGIRGYAGETPVLIALSKKEVITGVYALPNVETPRFAQHVQESGFYDQWNGLSVKKAIKKEVDTVSGATFTSRAVAQSVKAALEAL